MPYMQAVRKLVMWHLDTEYRPSQAFLFPDADEAVIRLIEVSDVIPETGEFRPLKFGPTEGIPYETIVALVTPGEWRMIQTGQLALPQGWDLGTAVEVTEEAAA
ncbi:MAG: hypothetical protein FJX74_20125 [Armatimonadetes bacterium]|nr:hypothetical protein [Armatimonadota bacterium]